MLLMTIYFIVLGSLFYLFFISASAEAKKDKPYGERPVDAPPLPSYIKEANQHVR
ncbi:hypothetical protein GA0061094_3467 [[Bacillus] enclensis]|uniref:Tumour necrosis factor receptor superfamily member 19 n=1 Tax=[Bacillus] enclensis TaxID=1402860 RepID=A0A1C4D195_9BACI|nr:hypothetical protein GA0061094_3467 [[Bacillus] enclensis]